MKQAHDDRQPHPGINFSRMPVGGDFAGLLIAVTVVAIALIGLPAVRWFLAGSLALGAAAALILRWQARDR